jgi:hypothetical protein
MGFLPVGNIGSRELIKTARNGAINLIWHRGG